MGGIPSQCPSCGNKQLWNEVVNPFTSGVPFANGRVRFGFNFLVIKGIFARSIKKKLGYYTVTYRCENCGYENRYDLR